MSVSIDWYSYKAEQSTCVVGERCLQLHTHTHIHPAQLLVVCTQYDVVIDNGITTTSHCLASIACTGCTVLLYMCVFIKSHCVHLVFVYSPVCV